MLDDDENEHDETPDMNWNCKNFEMLYSPRTEYSNQLDYEDQLFNDLTLNFDPITIKIIKKHFKERLGSLNKEEFVAILKNHLLSWHQELPNREIMLIKLLGRLFSEIDLNDNGSLEWAEFTNYIIHNSNSLNKKHTKNIPSYQLRFYFPMKKNIELLDYRDSISHAFFIDKLNLFGIVQEGKSVISFYEINTFTKLKTFIDLKEIQREIDNLEIKQLDKRTEEMLKKESKEKEYQLKLQKKIMKRLCEPMKTISKFTRKYDKPWLSEKRTMRYEDYKTTRSKFSNKDIEFNSPRRKKGKEYEGTPEKIKHELERIKREERPLPLNKKLTVVTTTFIPEYDVLLVSTTNNKICAWQYTDGEFKNVNGNKDFNIEKNYFKCAILSSESPQNALEWDPIQRNLYSGQPDGKILKWDLSKSKNLDKEDLDFFKAKEKKEMDLHLSKMYYKEALQLEKKFKDKKPLSSQVKIPGRDNLIKVSFKRDGVSCLVFLSKLQLLAASYYNGNIILWDPLLKDFRKFYFDQETGVYAMSFDSQKNLLITAGFNHDIYIYDPYIDNSAVYKLTGHPWSIISIACNEKESEIISLDIFGNIKIWDSQNFLNFQTINLNETIEVKKGSENLKRSKLSSNLKMMYMHKIKKILIYGTKLMMFETDRAQNPNLADDQLILACYYEKNTKSIISFCLRKIKIWNIFTGKVKKVYEDPMNNEVTAMTIDRNIKRAFLGDNTGRIRNFNMKNGNLLKELEPHRTEIKILTHSLSLNIVVSCSIDNIIKIHDDSELTESEVKKELIINSNQVKSIAICEKFARLAIGLSSGIIRFFDIEHFRYDGDKQLDNDKTTGADEVTCLSPIEDTDILFVGYSSGKCAFIVTPPSQMKFYSLVCFENVSQRDNKPKIATTCAEYDYDNKLMFIGDVLGMLKCYDMKEMFDLIEYAKSQVKSEVDPLITCKIVDEIKEINLPLKWEVQAHQDSIKHIHYVDIEPKILITTSNDLQIKLFTAENGEYKDELRQISIKYKPIPIGIKYFVTDPFKPKSEQVETEHIVMRKELDFSKMENVDELEAQQIGVYSKKIIEFKAKAKLWEHVKGINLKENQSNKWEVDIDIEKVKDKERKALEKEIQIVKKKETIIYQSEMIMQKKSIYNESYTPKFVSEMDEDELQDFSNALSQKLRQVRLAISKANLSQTKFAAFEREKKEREEMSKELHELINSNSYRQKMRNKLNPIKKKKTPFMAQQEKEKEKEETEKEKEETEKEKEETEKLKNEENEENEDNDVEEIKSNFGLSPEKENEELNQTERVKKDLSPLTFRVNNKAIKSKKKFKIINMPMELGHIKSSFSFVKHRVLSPEENFKRFNIDLESGYNEAKKACAMLARKTKLNSRNTNKMRKNLRIDSINGFL